MTASTIEPDDEIRYVLALRAQATGLDVRQWGERLMQSTISAPPQWLASILLGLWMVIPHAWAQEQGAPQLLVSMPVSTGLALPIACTAEQHCFVQNHVDHQAGPDYRDYRCGPLTYDGHSGTDIRIPNLAAMAASVPVLAAMAGRVKAVRDGMDDVNLRDIGYERIKGRDAGNTVLLEHAGGWVSQYAHMRKGSVAVRAGDVVAQGQQLGLVGLSGNTEFPHLHFEIRYNGKPVDPFTGHGLDGACGAAAAPLWDAAAGTALSYQPSGVINAGFAAQAPDLTQVMSGGGPAYTLPDADAPLLVFWVNTFGMRGGDVVDMRVLAPDGSALVEKRAAVPKNKADWLDYVGRRAHGAWPAGEYRGIYRVLRDGGEVLRVERSLRIR
ncbi:MAG: M23 family metallopeptidase [Methylococcaceae bacterium]|nr:MAG: M23 family metallopeptidase [Methylococcaceae bacterium]